MTTYLHEGDRHEGDGQNHFAGHHILFFLCHGYAVTIID